MNSNGTPQTDPNANHRRSSPLRVGLIAGLTLGVAIGAQQYASDSFGMIIVVVGLHVAGYYAARESAADSRRTALRAGLLGGLTAGVLTGLGFAAATMLLSLDAERTARLQDESLTAMKQVWPAYADIVEDEMSRNPESFRASYLLSTVIATACCSMLLPALGAAFGAVGGLLGAGRRDYSE